MRFVAVGAVTHVDRVGANRFHFAGRIAGKALRPGRYRLSAVARNAAGLRSSARTVDFRVVR